MLDNSLSVPTSPHRRRSALTDISNCEDLGSPAKKRRRSLGFDLVKIVTSPKSSKCKLPEPTSQPLAMNKKGSGIPTLKKSDRLERLLTINESLNRKAKINSQSSGSHKTTWNSSRIPHTLFGTSLDALISESNALDTDINDAVRDLTLIEEESSRLRLQNRSLNNTLHELTNVVQELDSKFEFLSGQVTTQVECYEQKMNLELKNYKVKTESSYSDTKYEIEREIENASSLESEADMEEMKVLEIKKRELASQLHEVLAMKDLRLKEEQASVRQEVQKQTEESEEVVNQARRNLESLHRQFESIESQYNAISSKADTMRTMNKKLQAEINEKMHIITNFDSIQEKLKLELRSACEGVELLRTRADGWDQQVMQAKESFDSEKRKYDSHVSTRRSLEHAIRKLTNGPSTLLKLDNLETQSSSNELKVGSALMVFDKVLCNGEEDDSLEWQLLVQESLGDARVSLVFCGLEENDLDSKLVQIFSFLRSGQRCEQSTISYQCIGFHANEISDLLNSSSEPDLTIQNNSIGLISQRMMVRNESDLRSTLANMEFLHIPHVHIFTIERKNGTSGLDGGMVMIVDLSQISLKAQADLLGKQKEDDLVSKVLHHSTLYHLHLNVCHLHSTTENSAQDILNVLQKKS